MTDTRHPPDETQIQALDAGQSHAELERLLNQHQARLAQLDAAASPVEQARIELDIAEALLGLQRQQAAWDTARASFERSLQAAAWQEAVEACDILYRTELEGAITALGNGVWLAVTYPIKAQTTVSLLHHIVDETPDKSDGAAVAAMAAHYIAGLRSQGKQRESLTFLTTQILAQVAKRHRGIEGQEMLNTWIEVLQLNDPGELLSRLAKMLDAIVAGNWWYDRDQLRAQLPLN